MFCNVMVCWLGLLGLLFFVHFLPATGCTVPGRKCVYHVGSCQRLLDCITAQRSEEGFGERFHSTLVS